jgi:hypothetical protein
MTDSPGKEERSKLTAAQSEQIRKAYQGLTAGMQRLDLSKVMPSSEGSPARRGAQPELDSAGAGTNVEAMKRLSKSSPRTAIHRFATTRAASFTVS